MKILKNKAFKIILYSFFLIVALSTNLTYANNQVAHSLSSGEVGIGQIVQTVIGLIAIIAFILVAAYIFKRTRVYRGNVAGNLKVLQILPIGTKERILLVEANGKKMLVGVTANSINTLHIFEMSELT